MTEPLQAGRDSGSAGRAAVDERVLERLVHVASRAPSAHNTQPWSPRVVPGGLEVSVVPSRTLPAGDPSSRDLLLALGAWVESVAVAAAEDGLAVSVEPLGPLGRLDELPVSGPADPEAPVLRLHLAPAEAPIDPVAFSSRDVLDRRVYRGELDALPDYLGSVPDLPAWLTLREVEGGVLRRLVRLGIAYTASRPSVAVEMLAWLRLDPAHPRYHSDGLTDRMLLMPRPAAALAAPFTRRARLRDPALAVAGALARLVESLERGTRLPRPDPSPAGAQHVVLVADARRAGADGVPSATESMDSRLGVPETAVLEAGRHLQRLWLHAHRLGGVTSPHSEVIDSPHAHGRLRRRLGLRRSEVALSVFTVGVPRGLRLDELPPSPRVGDAPSLRDDRA